MAENKNQSWPSVTGRARTGSGYDPSKISPLGNLQNLRKQKFQGEMALTSQYAAIMQNLGARSIANQEQLAMTRQTNLRRMADLYSSYFQEFGGVLNEGALKFLDDHSKIKVPTLTAIMAGYEHARASAADRELMALQKQEQLLKEGLAIEQERTALADKRIANDALALTTNLEQAAKSYSDYMSGVIADAGGAGATGRRGVGGAGGVGSGAASFQAPVTGGGGTGTGTGAVAGGGATGFVDPSNPQVAALNKMIDDSKAAQTAGQGIQTGPLTQRRLEQESQIVTPDDLINPALGVAALGGLRIPGLMKNNISGYLGNALTNAGTSTARGYFNVDDLTKAQTQLTRQQSRLLNAQRAARSDIGKLYNYLKTNYNLTGSQAREVVRNYGSNFSTLNDSKLESLYNFAKNRQDIITKRLDKVTTAQNAVTDLTKLQQEASKASTWSRNIGRLQRGAGKLLKGGVAGKVGLYLTLASEFGDNAVGLAAGAYKTGKNIWEDLSGTTLERLAEDPNYLTNREGYIDYYRMGRNTVNSWKNMISSKINWNAGLENETSNLLAGRLRELGYDPNLADLNDIQNMTEQERRDALEALFNAKIDQNGRVVETGESPWSFARRSVYDANYARTYATQANKAAQNQQVTDQEIMRDQRIADALAGKSKFFAGMAEYLTRLGREAGYDFDEADAAAMMERLIEMNQAMESGGKFGAEGENTSTGRAKSRHQFMDMTFDQLRKWMLEDDNKAGGIFFNDDERDALRQARTANDLDNEQFGHLLDLMVPYYLMKDNVNIGKFGKGNPNIGSLQALVDLSQMTKDIGISPYLDSSMNALRMAGFGRFKAGKEFDETVSRFNRDWQGPKWSAQFGDSATSDGVYINNDMYLQDLANNGILLGPYQNKVPANEYLQWVNDYFVVDKDGNITGIKEGANPKHLDKWREEKGLTRAQKVGVPQQISRSNNVRLDNGVNFDNLNRTLKQRVNKFADNLYSQYGFGIDVTSGHRTPEHQAKVKKDPNSSMPANPGSSPHQAGLGIDLSIRRLREAFNKSDTAKQKYNGDFNKFIEEEAKAAGLYRFDPKGDPFHFGMIEDDDYKVNVDHDLYMKDKAAGKLSDSKRYEKNQGLTLPSLPALRQVQSFSPARWTDPVVEPANQGVADFQGLDFLSQYINPGVVMQQPAYPQTNWQEAENQLDQLPQEGYINESMILR